jgi:hypothetical protein
MPILLNQSKTNETKCQEFLIRKKILDYCVLSFVSILMLKNEYVSENGYFPIFRVKGVEPPTVLCFRRKELFSLCSPQKAT